MHVEHSKVPVVASSAHRAAPAMPPLASRPQHVPVTHEQRNGSHVARLPHALHSRGATHAHTPGAATTVTTAAACDVAVDRAHGRAAHSVTAATPPSCVTTSVLTFGALHAHSHLDDDGQRDGDAHKNAVTTAATQQQQQQPHERTARSASIADGSARGVCRRDSSAYGGLVASALSQQQSQQQQQCEALHIAGVRTGEPVVIATDARRTSMAGSNSSSTTDADALARRRAARLQSVCTALQDKLQRASRQLRTAHDTAALASAEAEARLTLALRATQARETSLTALLLTLMRLFATLASAHARCDTQLRAQHDAHAARSATDAATLSSLQTQLAELTAAQARHDAERTAHDNDVQSQLAARMREVDELRQRSAHEVQQLECDKMALQEQLQQQARALATCEQQMAHDAYLVAQCRLFVKDVCQPTFHVVRDATLTPVDRARGSPTGYVLVPLVTLLHGYTLLPENERRDVIASYEEQAARTDLP